MKNLYYQTSVGVGKIVTDDDIKPCDYDLPENAKERGKNDFTVYVFGHDVKPSESKNPLFPCRDLISVLNCNYIGTDRINVVSDCHSCACSLVDKVLKNPQNKELVVIHDFKFDADDKEIEALLSNMYGIVQSEVDQYFNSKSSVVICIFTDKVYLEKIKSADKWGSSYTIFEDEGAILLYL